MKEGAVLISFIDAENRPALVQRLLHKKDNLLRDGTRAARLARASNNVIKIGRDDEILAKTALTTRAGRVYDEAGKHAANPKQSVVA
jgi:hypothetical protein